VAGAGLFSESKRRRGGVKILPDEPSTAAVLYIVWRPTVELGLLSISSAHFPDCCTCVVSFSVVNIKVRPPPRPLFTEYCSVNGERSSSICALHWTRGLRGPCIHKFSCGQLPWQLVVASQVIIFHIELSKFTEEFHDETGLNICALNSKLENRCHEEGL
jgi:hypothetical protein